MENSKGMGIVSGASVVVALMQSLCTAVLTINGIGVVIGLGALAAGSVAAPLVAFHRDAIGIPMLTLAVAGAEIRGALDCAPQTTRGDESTGSVGAPCGRPRLPRLRRV